MRKVFGVFLFVVAGAVAFQATGGDLRGLIADLLASDGKFDAYLSGSPGVRLSPDGRYSVEFPTAPARDREVLQAEGQPETEVVTYLTSGRNLSYGVAFVDLQGLSTFDETQRRETLEASALGAAGATKGEVLTWTHRPFLDRDSLEFTIRKGDLFAKATAMADGDRIYVLVVTDKRNPPRTYERFLYSFQPVAPGDAPAPSAA